LVSISAITLASETVRSILKIDDIVSNVLCTTLDYNLINSFRQLPNNFIYFRSILEDIRNVYVLISLVSNNTDSKLIIILIYEIN